MIQRVQKLKDLFKKEGSLIRLVGAHNGLTAKLVEKNGFEGVWASGFEISTSYAVPDANILTMSEVLTASAAMNEATSIPVVVDCDTGFGNSNNVIQMVKKFEAAGIDGVCIEDKLFPKVNSYIPGRQELAPVAEFVGKIMAGKNAQKTDDFMLFARVEALIAGYDQAEALKRAKAYADAGADAILIHSKKNSPDEIVQFAKAWQNYKPLIIIPTTYPSLTEEEMKKLGIKMVIYANQGIRASIKSINETLSSIAREGICHIEPKIATMQEVFELQDMPRLKEEEKKYLKTDRGDIKVLIPAAADVSSQESLKDLLQDIPLTMLDINGKTILQRTIDNLNLIDIQDIAVVTGYQGERVPTDGITKIDNPDYEQTGVMGSIMSAEEWLGKKTDKTLIVYSDILFDKDIIEKIIQNDKDDIVLVIDSSYQRADFHSFAKKDINLLAAKYPSVKEGRVITPQRSNPILKIGHQVTREEANYEFIGIAMFSPRGVDILRSEYHNLKNEFKDRPFSLKFTDMIQKLIEKGHQVLGVEVNGGWTEIKNFEDYKQATALLAR